MSYIAIMMICPLTRIINSSWRVPLQPVGGPLKGVEQILTHLANDIMQLK